MRKFLVLGVAALLMLSIAAPVWAADDDDQKWHVHGDIRARGDYFDNVFDYLDTSNGGVDDDTFGIWPLSVRISVDGELTDNIRGMVELRNDETFGGAPPVPTVVGDDPTFVSDSSNFESDVHLYQAFIEMNKIADTNFGVRIGRQEHTLGTELLMGDNDFYTGLTFDGARGWYGAEKWDINFFYYKLLETNFNPTLYALSPLPFSEASSDVNFFGASFDWKFDPKFGQLDVYYLQVQDLRGSAAPSAAGAEIQTYGARWGKLYAHDTTDMFDWNIEYAAQSGDTGSGIAKTDLSGDVIEGWFGFNFGSGAHHRVHVGYLKASGDDSTTSDNEAFIPLFGDNHAYDRLGGLDSTPLSNVEDINVGYTVWFGQDHHHSFMAAIHQLSLAETDTLTGEDDLGMIWDVNYGYMMTKNLSFEIGLSQGQAGDEQDALAGGSADNASRYYAQARLRW